MLLVPYGNCTVYYRREQRVVESRFVISLSLSLSLPNKNQLVGTRTSGELLKSFRTLRLILFSQKSYS